MQQPNNTAEAMIDERTPEQKLAEERRLYLERDALRHVLSTRQGRRFVWMLMGRCGLSRSPYAGARGDTDFNCGRQSVATDLLVDMEMVNRDAFHMMAKEAQEDERYDDRNPDDPGARNDPGLNHDPLNPGNGARSGG